MTREVKKKCPTCVTNGSLFGRFLSEKVDVSRVARLFGKREKNRARGAGVEGDKRGP
jgi:hypothetical protein